MCGLSKGLHAAAKFVGDNLHDLIEFILAEGDGLDWKAYLLSRASRTDAHVSSVV